MQPDCNQYRYSEPNTSGDTMSRRLLNRGNDVTVRIKRHGHCVMSEPFGHHLWMDSRLQHKCRVGVTQVVENRRKVEGTGAGVDESRGGVTERENAVAVACPS